MNVKCSIPFVPRCLGLSRIGLFGVLALIWGLAGCAVYDAVAPTDPLDQARVERDQGYQAYQQQRYVRALELYQDALSKAAVANDAAFNADLYYRIGYTHLLSHDYQRASVAFEQALKQPGTRTDDDLAVMHNMLGMTYQKLGRIEPAREHLNQALAFRRKGKDALGEARTLGNLGLTYLSQGRYIKALEYYRQARQLFSSLPSTPVRDTGTALTNIGSVYAEMGQYPRALDYQQQALAIYQAAGDQAGLASAFHNIGYIKSEQLDYPAAIKAFEQAIAIRTHINDRIGAAETRNNLGLTLSRNQQHARALEVLLGALKVLQASDMRKTLAATYDSLGSVHARMGDFPSAFGAYQQALAIWREIGDRDSARITLGNMGSLLEQSGQDALAIVFYKQSVNMTEQIRNDLRVLPEQEQKAYLLRVQGFYRSLADLLLRQDRVIEAQQVLDLLKVQEAAGFLGPVRGNEDTEKGISTLPAEQDIQQNYAALEQQAVQTGLALAALRKLDRAEWSDEQTRQWQELNKQERSLQRAFMSFVESNEIRALVDQLSREVRTEMPALEQLRPLKDNLARLGQQVVLIYPLVLDDRLEIVLATAVAPPLHVSVPLKHEELVQAVLGFRTALSNRQGDAKQYARTLYNWLIKPIEQELKQVGAETILYAPDGVLRYIPLAALYDGRQWLAQRYKINNITAFSLTDLETRPVPKPKLLAAAFASGDYDFTVGDQHFDFKGLPYAGQEVNNLAELYPDALKLMDQNFNPDAVVPELDSFNIIHFATHAALVSGKPYESFILFGNGARVTVDQVKYEWSLANVDLIVLSACETALGIVPGKGEEILGLGFLMESAGARATLASLWSVDDGGTQALMNAFYRVLKQPGHSKAEALRKAQVAMINSTEDSESGTGRGVQLGGGRSAVSYSHPYYWAPFILIGNGL